MEWTQKKTGRISRWSLLVGLLCVALVAFAGTISVVHGHEDGITHADCGLCATAHAPVQLAAAPAMAPVAQVLSRVQARVPAAPPRKIARFALFIRPPPATRHLTS
jgi:hypothetical protein